VVTVIPLMAWAILFRDVILSYDEILHATLHNFPMMVSATAGRPIVMMVPANDGRPIAISHRIIYAAAGPAPGPAPSRRVPPGGAPATSMTRVAILA
jgi:hypothetical protein